MAVYIKSEFDGNKGKSQDLSKETCWKRSHVFWWIQRCRSL